MELELVAGLRAAAALIGTSGPANFQAGITARAAEVA
jgi:hypothetical protein